MDIYRNVILAHPIPGSGNWLAIMSCGHWRYVSTIAKKIDKKSGENIPLEAPIVVTCSDCSDEQITMDLDRTLREV
jgi:hypothetical protein